MIDMPSWFKKTFPLAVMFAVAYGVYFNTFHCAWNLDDFPVVVDNPDIRSLANFFQDVYPGRPLREITYLFDYALFGLEPAGYHLQHLFWHGLNGFLLYRLLCRLATGRFVAWATALLFLVHPIQVEVVANISHRKDSLALCFSLLALHAYMTYFRSGARRWVWLLLASASVLLALTAKQIAVAMLPVFVAYELAFVAPEDRLLARWPKFLWGGALLALCGWALFLFAFGGMGHFLELVPGRLEKFNYLGGAGLGEYYRLVLKSWAFMFLRLFRPLDLAVEYSYPLPESWFDPWVIAGGLILLLSPLLALWSYFRRPVVFFFLVWAAAFWLPVSNLLWPLSYFAADRYLYAPSVGVIAVVVYLAATLARDRVNLLWLPAIPVLVALSVLTWHQNATWETDLSLWAQSAKVSPESPFALNNLASAHIERMEYLKAYEILNKALVANPRNSSIHYNMGVIYDKLNKHDKARYHFVRYYELAGANYPLSQAFAVRKYLHDKYDIPLE